MQSQAIQKTQEFSPTHVLERVIIAGDLSQLTPAERVGYYNHVCTSLDLNPLTRPFEYIQLNGKLVLYARKECTDQLRANRGVSIDQIETAEVKDCLIVHAHASLPNGRRDTSTGAVSLKGLIGDALANAMMKAETKAKRRVTLSICGLGFALDESEIDSIPGAQRIEAGAEITVSAKNSGLDQWKCSRGRAMEIINLCTQIKAKDKTIDDEQLRAKLPAGVNSRKELSELQAADFIKTLQGWLDELTGTVQGEVVSV